MGKPFIITINCTKILCDSEEAHFTMFIDDTKMTIVYELTEWIRWIFSLEDCLYLTHENSVIHELEDIRVLSMLKNFEIKPCGQYRCIHKGIYESLLSKLNLFGYWRDTRVPNIFLDKMNLLEKKLTQQNQLCLHDQNKQEFDKENSQTEAQEGCFADNGISSEKKLCNVSTDEHFEECKNEKSTHSSKFFSENKSNKTHIAKQARIDQCSKINPNLKVNTKLATKPMEEAFKGNKNKLEKSSFDTLINTNFNSHLEPSLVNRSTSPIPQNINSSLINIQQFSSPVKDLTKSGLKEGKNSGTNKTKKLQTTRYTKPFSLGQILSNLRDECKNNTSNDVNGESSNSSLSLNKFLPENNGDVIPADHQNSLTTNELKTLEKRKRKRTRRSRSSKRHEAKDNIITPPPFEFKWNIKKSVDETKPNHIRFKFDDNFMETDCHDTNEPNEELCNGNGSCSPSECVKTNVEDLVSMINEKKQALSVSNIQNFSVKCGESASKNETQTQENFIALEDKDYNKTTIPSENFNSTNFNKDLATLLQLKEKFPSPVVIERFF